MYVLIVILAVLTTLSFLLYAQINKKVSQTVEYKKEVAGDQAVLASSLDISKKINDVDSVTQKLNSLYVSEDKAVAFIEEVESIAKRNNVLVEISSVDLKKFVADEKNKDEIEHGNLKMIVSTKGEWSKVVGFLKEIEAMPYGVKVENSKMNFSESEKSGYWSLVFSLNAITN